MGQDVLIFGVLTTGAVLIVTQLVRLLGASMLHRTIREAISRDSAAVPALLDGVGKPQSATPNDDRTAMVLIALGLALFLFGLIQGDPDDIRNLGGAALFPILVGAALLIRHFYAKRQEQRP